MKRVAAWVLSGSIAALAAAGAVGAVPELTAAQIVAKNMTARGGLEAWRKIQTMVWIGHIESTNAPAPSLRFILEQKRPDKTRFEIGAPEQRTVRLYDGHEGWTLRTGREGQPKVQPYTEEELRYSRDAGGLDGPLMDYRAKGVTVVREGVDQVEGRKAYRLRVTLPSGASHHVWIDTKTFLDIKYDRESRNAFGVKATVSVFNRDYRTIDGLQMPYTVESGADNAKTTDKMVIDKIVLNPPLQDQMFARPWMPWSHNNGVTVDTTRPPPVGRMVRPAPSVSRGMAGANSAAAVSGAGR